LCWLKQKKSRNHWSRNHLVIEQVSKRDNNWTYIIELLWGLDEQIRKTWKWCLSRKCHCCHSHHHLHYDYCYYRMNRRWIFFFKLWRWHGWWEVLRLQIIWCLACQFTWEHSYDRGMVYGKLPLQYKSHPVVPMLKISFIFKVKCKLLMASQQCQDCLTSASSLYFTPFPFLIFLQMPVLSKSLHWLFPQTGMLFAQLLAWHIFFFLKSRLKCHLSREGLA
jgi:hypothetical protein